MERTSYGRNGQFARTSYGRNGDRAGHLAIQSRVSGGLRFTDNGGIRPNEGMPTLGESLFFVTDGRDLVTSPIVAIERPVREIVARY